MPRLYVAESGLGKMQFWIVNGFRGTGDPFASR